MKYLIIALISFTSCKQTQKRIILNVHNGEGFTETTTQFECDSFKMTSNQSADVWLNGRKMVIICNGHISPSF